MGEVTPYLVHILVELGAFFLMLPFHCFNIPYQFFVLNLLEAQTLYQQSRDKYVESYSQYEVKKREYLLATGR